MVAGAKVTVTATAVSQTTVAKTATVAADATSVAIAFDDDFCDDNADDADEDDDEPCQLADADWTITATHTQSSLHAPTTSTAATDIEFTVDTVGPTIGVAAASTSLDAGVATQITFTVSDDDTDFELADVSVSPEAAGSLVNPSFPTSGTTYTAMFSVIPTEDTDYTISVPADAFTDPAGNGNAASDPDATISVAAKPPAPTVALADSSNSGATDDLLTNHTNPTLHAQAA